MPRNTEVAIDGEQFLINGEPTYKGRYWYGHKIEGLLMNSRMVQATFDDLNPETRSMWNYPDGGEWDAIRNTSEFIDQMPIYRDHGLLGITINLQGGSPQGYSKEQPWINSAVESDGSLRDDYMTRVANVLKRADELGMVIILGILYFGQEKVLHDETAIRAAVDNTVQWVLDNNYRNVLIEINNECNVRYQQPILQPEHVHELILQAKSHEKGGQRLLVGTSYGGNQVARANVVQTSDFILMHGNGVRHPGRIAEMVRQVRQVEGYRTMPILFNEDDHFDFDQPNNNMLAAVSEYASWGYFDYRMTDEGFDEGYQSVPVNWQITSERKRGFFNLVREVTGA